MTVTDRHCLKYTFLKLSPSWLRADAGVEKGELGVGHSAMGMDIAALEDADPFDRAFIDMMIPHHEGAVTMAKAERAKGEDPELRRLAEDVVRAQQREIREMRAQR